METTNDIFREAQVLAEFSNLEADKAEWFRHNYPDFVPKSWWILQVGNSPKIWKTVQEELRSAWRQGFPLELCIRMINAGNVPDLPELPGSHSLEHHLATNVVTIPIEHAETFGIRTRGLNEDMWIAGNRVWPYQRAVMFLGTHPWQASICTNPSCGKRFVKDRSSRRFCNDRCFQDSRKLAKKSWWSEHGEAWRAKGSKKQNRRKKEK